MVFAGGDVERVRGLVHEQRAVRQARTRHVARQVEGVRAPPAAAMERVEGDRAPLGAHGAVRIFRQGQQPRLLALLQAQDVHAFIRNRVAGHSADVADKVRILYGGSMKPGNAAELMAKPDIDGGLIGGASLKAPDFLAIAEAAAQG